MIDRFTKMVLMVIAICLVALVAKTFQTSPVQAEFKLAPSHTVDLVAIGGKNITPIMASCIVENLQGRG